MDRLHVDRFLIDSNNDPYLQVKERPISTVDAAPESVQRAVDPVGRDKDNGLKGCIFCFSTHGSLKFALNIYAWDRVSAHQSAELASMLKCGGKRCHSKIPP
jgi:hypothetical protein